MAHSGDGLLTAQNAFSIMIVMMVMQWEVKFQMDDVDRLVQVKRAEQYPSHADADAVAAQESSAMVRLHSVRICFYL